MHMQIRLQMHIQIQMQTQTQTYIAKEIQLFKVSKLRLNQLQLKAAQKMHHCSVHFGLMPQLQYVGLGWSAQCLLFPLHIVHCSPAHSAIKVQFAAAMLQQHQQCQLKKLQNQ